MGRASDAIIYARSPKRVRSAVTSRCRYGSSVQCSGRAFPCKRVWKLEKQRLCSIEARLSAITEIGKTLDGEQETPVPDEKAGELPDGLEDGTGENICCPI